MDNIPEITIIIPIHNRILFLPQILEYYSRFKKDINLKIIVADSSSADNFDNNKKVVDKFADLSILHIPIHGRPTLYDKIIGALKYVETEFCVCCADDDFVTVSGLKKTCDFLKSYPDFVVAHGAYISFNTRPNRKKWGLYWRQIYGSHSVDDASPEQRLTDQFLNFKPTLYAVHRTYDLKCIFEEVKGALDSEVKILLFGELLISMLAAIRGKIKDLNILYSVRRKDSPYQGQHIKWPTKRDYFREGKLEAESIEFKECLARNLSVKMGLNFERAQILVKVGLSSYLKKVLQPDYFRHFVLNTANFLKNTDAPIWLYKNLSRVYRIFVPVKRGGTADDLAGTNLSAYNEDFKILREIVLKYAQNKIADSFDQV
ncbi:MAG: TIGR00180 family glycosyltransferase [Candidatus Yanofskybacteria bacterium]|nr:TIGR00180 family glycosyltransferase [Candidatus Yanofskybacteria bacterium]